MVARWRRLSRRNKGIVIVIAVVVALAMIGRTPAEPAAVSVVASPTAEATATPTPTAVPTAEPTPAAKTAEDYVKQYGGLTGAYRSVLGETDCAKLADLFTVANNNHTIGFMVAIDDRMRAIGCP